jgi:Flp pilus assembly protein TadG
MTKRSKFLQSCSALIADRGGNFALMAALVIPVLFASGGVAMDMANMMMAKNQLQDATDTAALAASSALINEGMSIENATKLAKEFLKNQSRNSLTAGMSPEELAAFDAAFINKAKVNIVENLATNSVGNSKTYTVDISSSYSLPLNPLTQLLGKKTAQISATSKSMSSSETKSALSMFLVLDRSGSMGEDTATVNEDSPTKPETYSCGTSKKPKTCTRYVTNYIKKIEALKTAATNLLLQLKTADSTSSLVRTGSVSYNNTMQTASSLAWGTPGVSGYVDALTATGGTDSSAAFKTSYDRLMALNSAGALAEEKAHHDKSGLVPKKYIVFMTDGENNYFNNKSTNSSGDSSDAETQKYCKKAKDDGITVFTIAFMAPDRGQKLLDACATDDTTTEKYYFAAEDADQLNLAFKYIGEKASEMTVRLTQ